MRTFWLTGKEGFDPRSQETHTPIPFKLSNLALPLSNSDVSAGFESPSIANDSCLSLFHECKKNAKNEVMREDGYRSAPVITFSNMYKTTNYIM